MAVDYDATVRTARMQAVADLADGGKLEIFTAAYATLLAEFTLHSDLSGDAVGDVWTIKFTGDVGSLTDAANNTGTAAVARIRNAGDTVTLINNLTVGAGSGDVNLDSTSITSGQNVTINSATITHYT